MRPEQTKLALTMADGSLAIMHFVTRGFNPDGSVQFEAKVSDQSVRAECAKCGFDLARWRVISDEELPSDREYRNAWVDRGGRIDHDMTKARELCRQKLRAARAPKLAALDVEYQRADEDNDAWRKQQVTLEKRRLRDITADPRIDKAASVDDLKAITGQA